jgi:hypothetical protein
MDTLDGTFVWTHSEEEHPRPLVQLYRGTIKTFSNWKTSLEGGLALVEDN